MVFSSLPFLFLFLPLCLLLYFSFPAQNIRGRNSVLLLMSLLFYAAGEPVYVFLMIGAALVGWVGGLRIDYYRANDPKKARIAMWCTSILVLAGLFVFKYYDFLAGNLGLLIRKDVPLLGLSMPIGISFYTFQILTYDIDLYRDRTRVQKSFPAFLLYVSLFPQLIAGPILRYDDVAEQLNERKTGSVKFTAGVSRFLTGCVKKAVIANSMGELIDLFWGEAHDITGLPVLVVWLGVACYTLQIYFDFSGYSDMAIGLGKMFGFTYKENFEHPYVARSITEFWRRWHISLSSFFRDYVYIPLGGNRRHRLLNLFVVWTLTGFWHGASWNYLLWGFYYFMLLAIEKFVLKNSLEKIPVLNHVVTLLLVMIGWEIFYFEDISLCFAGLKTMLGLGGAPLWDSFYTVMLKNRLPMLLLSCVLCLPIGKLVTAPVQRLRKKSPWGWFFLTLFYQGAALFLTVSFLVSSTVNPFLYFRF